MTKSTAIAISAILVVALALPAHAHEGRHLRKGYGAVSKTHYGGMRPELGYWRRGPKTGYGFGFSTYKGDPFGSDDYYDRGRCFYMHHRDTCVKDWIFSGFR